MNALVEPKPDHTTRGHVERQLAKRVYCSACGQDKPARGGLRDGRVDALLLSEYGRLAWKIAGRPACRHRTQEAA